MGKLIWNDSGLAEKIDSPISFITGANLKKKPEASRKQGTSKSTCSDKIRNRSQ